MTANKNRRICCVEGLHEDGGKQPTIKPMLKLLTQWDYWPHVHKQCKTIQEAKAFLRKYWRDSTDDSVLFFFTHGEPGRITLSEGESISLGDLAHDDCLRDQCQSRYVHFCACDVLEDKSAIEDFLRETGAAAVSGYRTDVGWADSDKPAVLSDLMLLNQLWEADIGFSDLRQFKTPLKQIEGDLQRRFGDCEFKMMVRQAHR